MSHPPPPVSRDDAFVEIRVLGPLEVSVAGRPIVVDTRKALAILALLAVEDRPYARDELAAMLWPEADGESARGALRRTLSVLRGALGKRWIRVDRSLVGFDPADAWVDLAALERGARSQDLATLRQAVHLARGPFLAGFALRDSPEFDDWRAMRSVAVERSIADALDRLAIAAELAGDLAAARDAAARRIELDPLDEPAHRRLMELLARSGDRAGAIRQYRACVATLERELGVAPLAETTELYEAIRDDTVGPSSLPDRSARPGRSGESDAATVMPVRLPLIARDTQLSAILAARGSPTSDGRVLAIVGEAGIGKTRLVEAAADAVLAGGGRVVQARAFSAEAGIAYGTVLELLRAGLVQPGSLERLQALPGAVRAELERIIVLPDRLARDAPRAVADLRSSDPPAARTRLLDAIAAALTALVAGPVSGLVVVEDAQWADDASREAIVWLARRLAGRPLLLLVAWRPEDLDELGVGFAATIEDLAGGGHLALSRLDRDGVGLLVAAAVDAGMPAVELDAVLELSEGLPLYVIEALAAGSAAEGPSRTARALLRERLAAVSETAAQVLSAGAVIGRSFELPLVRGTSGRSDEETITALEELVKRGLVREVPGRPAAAFDFAHARLRDAAYEATSLARRRLLHARVADLLRAESTRRDDPGRLVQVAVHERAAGRDAEAAEAFRAAGLRAQELFAHREAAAHLETALALGHPDLAGIQVALGEVWMAEGDYGRAIVALEAAAAVSDEAELPGVELRLGRVHARRGDLAAAASHLDAVIESVDDVSATGPVQRTIIARALVERSAVALRGGDLALAASSAARARSAAVDASDPAAEGAAHRMLGLVARERGELELARSSLVRSLELAGADPDTGAAIAARNALALVASSSGDHQAAIGLLEAALEACRRMGERHLEAAVENNLADELHAVHRREEAMEHLKRAVALFAEVGGRPGELEPEIWKLVAW